MARQAAGYAHGVPVSPASIQLPERYRVLRHIANGGMASVWEAEDQLLARAVAVKLLANHLTEDERARRRFQREARAAAGLSSHPHVVTIYDVGEHDGRSFIVMELMRGGSLGDVLRDGRPVDNERALRWLAEAAGALDAAHEAGIVHRDIKPANLLLDEHDRLAIADFGIARLAWEEQVTQTGQILGTAAYVSPEQALGEPATDASDRYAFAVVAFELLTGEKPFVAEHYAAQARAHIEDPPPAASERRPELPPVVDRVLARGMAKDPAERWPTAGVFVSELADAVGSRRAPSVAAAPATRAFTERTTVAPPPPPPPTRGVREPFGGPPPPRRRRSWIPFALALLLVLAALGFIFGTGDGDGGGGDDERAAQPTATPEAAKKKDDKKADRERERSTPTPSATAESTPAPTATATATAAPASQPDLGAASSGNASGFALARSGDYAAAVTPLRQAVDACGNSAQLDPCGYALYNLGVALRLSGDAAGAVAPLQQRLDRFDDRDDVVAAELERAKAGDTSTPAPGFPAP